MDTIIIYGEIRTVVNKILSWREHTNNLNKFKGRILLEYLAYVRTGKIVILRPEHLLSKEDIEEVLELATKRLEASPQLRYGQAIFNEVFKKSNKLGLAFRNTKYDPFFDDSKIVSFLMIIKRRNDV